MIKSISRKMKYLLVAVFAFVLSFTVLIVSMPKAHAAPITVSFLVDVSLEDLKESPSAIRYDSSGYGAWHMTWPKFDVVDGKMYLQNGGSGTISYSFKNGTNPPKLNSVYATFTSNGGIKMSRITGMYNEDPLERSGNTFTTSDKGTINNKEASLIFQISNIDYPEVLIEGLTFQVTFTPPASSVSIDKGTGIKDMYLSTDQSATSGSPSGTEFDNDSTVYGFAKLDKGYKHKDDWTLVSGTVDSENAIYRVGSVSAGTSNFGTISADLNTYNITYTLDGGTHGTTHPDTYNVTTDSFTISNPTKTGYDFTGWSGTGISGKSTSVTVSKGSIGDRAYTANWELKQEIKDVISKINTIGTVSYPGSKTKINTARSAYDSLNSSYKSLVSNYNTLTTAESTYSNLKNSAINNTISLIDSIGEVTYPDSKASIVAAENAYSALDSSDKSAITNYGTLTAARVEYDSLGEEKVNEVIAAINAIDPGIAYPKSEAELDNANALYNALDSLEKPEVTNYDTLVGYNTTYATLRENEVNNVIALINAIVTPFYLDNYKAQITAARTAFDNLGNNDKNEGVITNLQKLLDAEAATPVVVQIQNIGEAFDNDEYRNKVSEAYDAYMALTDNQKAMIPDSILDILMDDREIVSVMDAINAIGDVEYTSESKALIDAANTAYEALDEDLEDSVVNYDKLVQANIDYDKVDESVVKINNIPEFEYTSEFKDIIDDARNTYDALTDYQKYILPQDVLDKLLDAEEKYDAIDKITNIGKIENTKESRDRVKKAKEAYDALDGDQKQIVSDEALKNLNDALAVVNVIDEVNKVKNAGYTTKDKENIDATRTSYNALTEDQKELFPANTLEMLTNIETTYPVMVTINQIGKVEYTDDFKAKLDSVKAIYDSLTDAQKKLVRNYVVLSVDMQSYDKVDDAYKAIETIDKIKYNKSSKEAIEEARKCYKKLSDEEKELIPDEEEKLLKAEKRYEKAEHSHNVGMAWVTAICIIFGIVILSTGLWLLILLLLKRRKDDDDEEEKNNNKKSKK